VLGEEYAPEAMSEEFANGLFAFIGGNLTGAGLTQAITKKFLGGKQ
jgi:hypothetical protein